MAKKIKAATLLKRIQKNNSGLMSEVKTGMSKVISGFNFNDDGGIQIFKRREIVQPYLHPIDSRLVNEQIEKTVKNDLREIDPEIDKNYEKLLPKHLVNDLYSLYYNPTGRMRFESLDKTNKVKFDILDSINNSLIKIVTNNSNIGSYVYTEEIGKFLYKKFMTLPPEQRKKLEDAMNNCNQGGGGQSRNQGQSGGGGGRSNQSPGGSNNQSGNNQSQPQNQQPQNQSGGGGKDKSDEEPEYEIQAPPQEDQDDYVDHHSNEFEYSQRNGFNDVRGAANNSSGQSPEKDMSQEAADQMDKDLKDMVDMLNSKQSQKELEQHFKQAEEKLEKLREIGVDIEDDQELPEVEKREIIANLNNLDSIRYSLSRLNTSKDKILKAVQKILNGASNYFSPKCITKDVELFEADEILNINGIELLHPVFRKSRILDLSITERKYIGKFDLYIDCSGSMDASCGGKLHGVPRIDLAKSLAMQMKEMGILGDLYEFEDKPKQVANTDISILMMQAGGGTNIENVLKNILKTGNNSVILTDGESAVSSFTHKAFFIGIGTDFYYFRNDKNVGQKYIEQNQCIHYTGDDFVETTMTNGSGRSYW